MEQPNPRNHGELVYDPNDRPLLAALTVNAPTAAVPLCPSSVLEGAVALGGLPFAPYYAPNHARQAMIGKYRRYMPVAQAYAAMSKYPGTKVGCLVLGPGFETRAEGWNGAPRGSKADVDGRLADRDTRLLWACHAEANAIANAARSGTSLLGCTMLVTLMPCMACAKSAVQAGIVRVIVPSHDALTEERWKDDFKATRDLFNECGVDLIEIDTTEKTE